MMISIIRACVFTLIFILPVFPALAATYYVSPNGGSSSGSINDPWSLDVANKRLLAGDKAILRGGVYKIPIAPSNSGNSNNQRIIYQAYPGEIPIIDLGSLIKGGWSRYQGTDGVDAVYRIATDCSGGRLAQDRFEDVGPNAIWWNRGEVSTRLTSTTNNPSDLSPGEFFSSNGYIYAMTVDADDPSNHNIHCISSSMGFDAQNKKYITLDGIVLTYARRGIYIRNNSSYITIQNCEVKYSGWNGVHLRDGVDHIIFRNNFIEGSGAGHEGGNLNIADTSHSLFENNKLTYGAHHALKMDGSDYNIITGNEVSKVGGKGFTISSSNYNTIENNKITDAPTAGELKGLHEVDHHGMEFAGENNIIRFNVFWNNSTGIGLTSYESPLQNLAIYNNTFVDNHTTTFNYGGGIENHWDSNDLTFDDIIIINNLFLNNSSDNGAGQIGFGPNLNLESAKIVIQNNLLFDSATGRNGQLFEASYSMDEFESKHPSVASGNIQADPNLVNIDANNPDYALREGSPAIDMGRFLTKAEEGGSGTVLKLMDARYFSDGRGIDLGDEIIVGSNNNIARIQNVNYENNMVTVDRSLTWNKDDTVNLVQNGSIPDIGAFAVKIDSTTITNPQAQAPPPPPTNLQILISP